MISAVRRKIYPVILGKSVVLVCMVALCGMILSIFQDYLFTERHNTPFVFFESLLFKCVWVVFFLAYLCSYKSFHMIKEMSHQKLILLYGALVFCHVFVSTVMVWAISWIFKDQGYGLAKILAFTFSNDSSKILFIYFLSMIYLKRFYSPTLDSKEANEITDTAESQPKNLEIKNGRQHHLVSFDAILCIKADSPYVLVQTEDNSYLHSSSLKKVGEELDSRFFKLHRSCIVNIDKVTSYQSRLNGDYDVCLSGHINVRLSRNHAKQFKAVIGDLITI